jgi:hypothetical protein
VDVILRFAWLFTVELAAGLQIYRRAMEHSSPISHWQLPQGNNDKNWGSLFQFPGL